MAKEKLEKRTYRIAVVIDGATKEFAEGMGVGVIGTQDVTFNLPPEQYNSPLFEMGLDEWRQKVALSFISTTATEVK